MSHNKTWIYLFGSVALVSCIWLLVASSPLFLNSYISRLSESDLPSVVVENDSTVYCRMKADDFRFPLPPRAISIKSQISRGGFDSVEGTIRVNYVDNIGMSASEYEDWVRGQLQAGGRVSAVEQESSSMLITFNYFGDR